MIHVIHAILTARESDITWWQMSARAMVIFCFAIALFRVFLVRVFGRITALDITIAITLGSTLSRAMTGNAQFLPTLLAVTVLMSLHTVLVRSTVRFHTLGRLIKGHEVQLVRGGQMLPDAMYRAGISENDLREALRLRCGTGDLAHIDDAWLERGGAISFVTVGTLSAHASTGHPLSNA